MTIKWHANTKTDGYELKQLQEAVILIYMTSRSYKIP